jgi:hypothetical protein
MNPNSNLNGKGINLGSSKTEWELDELGVIMYYLIVTMIAMMTFLGGEGLSYINQFELPA